MLQIVVIGSEEGTSLGMLGIQEREVTGSGWVQVDRLFWLLYEFFNHLIIKIKTLKFSELFPKCLRDFIFLYEKP